MMTTARHAVVQTVSTLPSVLGLLVVLAWPAGDLLAAEPAAGEAVPGLQIKPVLLDGKSSGTTLGLDYKYERQWKWSPADADTVADGLVELRGEGTVAASAARNPNKLLDLAVNLRYQYLGEGWLAGAGASLKAETDQRFDDRQLVWAAQLQAWRLNPLGANGWGVVYLNLGRVQPGADATRKAALAADPGGYRRWDLEAIYHHNLKGRIGGLPLRSLEFQYRHFQELSPKAAIEAAGLDRHRLGTVRLNLGDDKFIAYSRGRLPFDKQSDRAVKIGVEYKFP